MQYLYLILCKTDNDKTHELYKIGVANDVESRLAQLQTGSPFELEIMECYGFDNAEIAERAIHQAFTKNRVRGEWFELNFTDVHKYKSLCEMLGGEFSTLDNYEATDEEIKEAEETAEPAEGARWDYQAMFADGWRMEKTGKGKYWQWRERKHNGKTIYGGSVASLPCSIEEMRIKYESERTIS